MAQNQKIDSAKSEIYQIIINHSNSFLNSDRVKKIYIDNTKYTFSAVKSDAWGSKMSNLEFTNVDDLNCFSKNVKCVDNKSISSYKLNVVYKEAFEKEQADFIGIYAPIDFWYSLYENDLKNRTELNYKSSYLVYIPVIYKYVRKQKVLEQVKLYTFTLNEKLEILKVKISEE